MPPRRSCYVGFGSFFVLLAVAGMGAMIIQLSLGAVVRRTHSGLACPAFPGCLNGFFPIPLTFGTGIASFTAGGGIAW